MRRTVVGLGAAALGLGLYGGARLLFNAVGLRALGAEAVGQVNLALAAAIVLSMPASAGGAAALSRYVARARDGGAAAAALRRATAWGAAGTVAFLAAGLWFASWPALTAAFALLYAGYALGRALLLARAEPGRLAAVEAAAFVLFLAAMGVLLARGGPAAGPLLAYHVPGTLVLAAALTRRPAAGAPEEGLGRFAAFALAGSAAGIGVQQAAVGLAARVGGLAGAGLWAVQASALAPVLLLPRTLNSWYFPRLAEAQAAGPEAVARTAREHARITAWAGFPLVAVLLLAGGPLLRVLLGRPPDADLSAAWTWMCVYAYAVVRREPRITAAGALGHATLTAAAAALAVLPCAAVWAASLARGGGLAGVAAGLAAHGLAVPLLLALRPVPGLPPARPHPLDLAFGAIAAGALVL